MKLKYLIGWMLGISYPAKTKHLYSIYTMLDQRRRRWLALYKCHTNVLCLLGNNCFCLDKFKWLWSIFIAGWSSAFAFKVLKIIRWLVTLVYPLWMLLHFEIIHSRWFYRQTTIRKCIYSDSNLCMRVYIIYIIMLVIFSTLCCCLWVIIAFTRNAYVMTFQIYKIYRSIQSLYKREACIHVS